MKHKLFKNILGRAGLVLAVFLVDQNVHAMCARHVVTGGAGGGSDPGEKYISPETSKIRWQLHQIFAGTKPVSEFEMPTVEGSFWTTRFSPGQFVKIDGGKGEIRLTVDQVEFVPVKSEGGIHFADRIAVLPRQYWVTSHSEIDTWYFERHVPSHEFPGLLKKLKKSMSRQEVVSVAMVGSEFITGVIVGFMERDDVITVVFGLSDGGVVPVVFTHLYPETFEVIQPTRGR